MVFTQYRGVLRHASGTPPDSSCGPPHGLVLQDMQLPQQLVKLPMHDRSCLHRDTSAWHMLVHVWLANRHWAQGMLPNIWVASVRGGAQVEYGQVQAGGFAMLGFSPALPLHGELSSQTGVPVAGLEGQL